MASTACATKVLTLTADQEKAVRSIMRDIDAESSRILLCGYAGTGKTVTTAALVTRLSSVGYRVVVATPTHKARAQVEKALRSYGARDFEATTIHRLLGLRQQRDFDTGKETFEPDPYGTNMLTKTEVWDEGMHRYMPVSEIDVVIVDECSMLNSELYDLLLKELDERPVVFVGDDRQLLPVGEDSVCRAFTSYTTGYRLMSVLRHDGAILNLATKTRELDTGRAPFVSTEGGDTRVIAYRSQEEWLLAVSNTFKSSNSLYDPDHCRVLAWTNRTVEALNRQIHEWRYGIDAPEFVAGMSCLTADAIPNPAGGSPLLYSTTDVVIESAIPEPHIFNTDLDWFEILKDNNAKKPEQPEPWNTWRISAYIPGDTSSRVTFRVIAQDSLNRWKTTMKAIRDKAKEASAERRRMLWRLYFTRKDSVGRLQPSSALTIHKSQGSTFRNVFLHKEIDGWSNTPTRQQNQLAYVGITRASSALHVLADQ